jgi:homoserine dehydrogenase
MTKKIQNIALSGFGPEGLRLLELGEKQIDKRFAIKAILPGSSDKIPPRWRPLVVRTYNGILLDESIDVVIELQRDPSSAFHAVSLALIHGKQAIATNVKMLGTHPFELLEIQAESGTTLSYSSAISGALPILGSIDNFFQSFALKSIQAVFAPELAPAQELRNLTNSKLAILSRHAFGSALKPSSIPYANAPLIDTHNIDALADGKTKIQLVSTVIHDDNSLYAFTLPQLVRKDQPLAVVGKNEEAFLIDSISQGTQFLYGPAQREERAYSIFKELNLLVGAESVRSISPLSALTLNDGKLELEVLLQVNEHNAPLIDHLQEAAVAGHQWLKGWIKLDIIQNHIQDGRLTLIATGQTGRIASPKIRFLEKEEVSTTLFARLSRPFGTVTPGSFSWNIIPFRWTKENQWWRRIELGNG